jgi:hypothetical protein
MKHELGVVEIEILFKLDNGEKLKVDMNMEVQEIMIGMLYNFFNKDIPFVEKTIENALNQTT